MKKMIAISLLSLTTVSAFSAPARHFYECGGLSGADDYRVGINLKSKKAGFFDNDTTSYMKHTDTLILESNPPQIQMIFKGKEANYDGGLKLYFNFTRKTVSLYSIDNEGNSTEIGSADCVNAEPWDDLN
jgi:hypothetical protein